MTQEEYRTAWIEAEYIVAGWWESEKESHKETKSETQGTDKENNKEKGK